MNSKPGRWAEETAEASLLGPSEPGIDVNEEFVRRARAAAKLRRQIEAARLSIFNLYALIWSSDDGSPPILKDFHKQWNRMMLGRDALRHPDEFWEIQLQSCLIEAARGTTKCRTAGQRVTLASGVPVPIEALAGSGPVSILAFDVRTGQLQPTQAAIIPDGEKPIIEIETWSGRVHRLTLNEPMWTEKGWQPAGEIRVNMHVGQLRRVPPPFTRCDDQEVNADEAYLIGLLTGDGGCKRASPILSCGDDWLLRGARKICQRLGINVRKCVGDNVDYRLTSGVGTGSTAPGCGIAQNLLRKFDLFGKDSHAKRLHPAIFSARDSSVAAFLAGYWDADGVLPTRDPYVAFCSVSRGLLEDIQTLLLRFGIVGILRDRYVKYKGEQRPYNLLILHGQEARSFVHLTMFKSKKGYRAKQLWRGEHTPKNGWSSRTSCIPVSLMREALGAIRPHFFARYGVRLATGATRIATCKILKMIEGLRHELKKPRIKKRCDARYPDYTRGEMSEAARRLERLVSHQDAYWWDAVVRVTLKSPEPVYALQSDKYHTFVCENGIAHNTAFLMCAVMWVHGHAPDWRTKWLGATDPKAHKRLKTMRQYLLRSPMLQMAFPLLQIAKDRSLPNNASCLTLERTAKFPDATIEARGILTPGGGDRADLIALDDIVDKRNALQNPSMRPEVVRALTADWLPTLAGPKICWNIFNTWTNDDANSHLKRTTNWSYMRLAHGKPGDPYHSCLPELFPREELMRLRIREGPVDYARSRLCMAITSDSVAIMPDDLRPYSDHPHDPARLDEARLQQAVCVLVCDPSSGKKLERAELDPCGFAIMLFWPHIIRTPGLAPRLGSPPYFIWVPEAFGIRCSPQAQVAILEALHAQWMADYVVVEAEGLSTLHTWLTRIPPDIVIPATSGGLTKGQRLMSITPLIQPPAHAQAQMYFHPQTIPESPEQHVFSVQLPDGTTYECLRPLRHQLVNFPADHDDVMDTVVHGARLIMHYIAPQALSDAGFPDAIPTPDPDADDDPASTDPNVLAATQAAQAARGGGLILRTIGVH